MTKPIPPKNAALMTVVLALLAMFPPLATDMYLAAIGEVTDAFATTRAAAEMSLSLFFLGLCVGQLIAGPLIDAFGRKLPLLAGTVLFCVASVGLLLARDIAVFNALRFVQAIGACAGMVVGRAIVSDLYEGRRAAKVLTVLVMLMTLGPILAPSLGSLLLTAFGWRSIFYALVAIGGLALVLTLLVIPETLPPEHRQPGAMKSACRQFGALARRRAFLLPALMVGCVQAPMFAFITASSGIFQRGFGLSAIEYGVLFGVVAAALIIFGHINTRLLNRYDPSQIITAAVPLFVAASSLLLLMALSGNFWALVPVLWLTIGLVGLLSANVMSVAMAASPEAAGTGSAAIGFSQFGMAFATSSLVALAGGGAEPGSALPMAGGIVLAALAALALWTAARRDIGAGLRLSEG